MRNGAAALGLTGTLGLALGSGAARGWAHIGVIRALQEAGLEPEVVCGTSMGAVVGAAYSAGELDAFESWVRQLEWRQVISLMDLAFRGGLLGVRPLGEFFDEHMPGARIERLDKHFAAVATDLASGREVWLRNGPLVDALHSSIAIPGLVAPARHKDRWLVDGGLVNPVPVSLCRVLGAESVIAVDLNTTLLSRRLGDPAPDAEGPDDEHEEIELGVFSGQRFASRFREMAADVRDRLGMDPPEGREASPSIFEVMANSVNIMQMRIGRSRMAGDPPELLITPRLVDYGIFDFDRAAQAIAEGRRATHQALQALGTD